MHTITRGVVAVAVATAGLLAVAGCVAQPASDASTTAQATTTPTATSAPTAAATSIDFGPSPQGAGVPTCEQLLPAELVEPVVPGARLRDTLADQALVSGEWAAATQVGGTDCWSTNGVSPLEEVVPGGADGPRYEGVELTVLPDAGPEFADATAGADSRLGYPGPVWCAATDSARLVCRGQVLAGHAWVELASTRMQDTEGASPEQAEPLFRALLDRVQATVAAAPVAAVTTDHATASGKPTTCTTERVDQVTSAQLVDPRSYGSDANAAPTSYALDRFGGAACSFWRLDAAFTGTGAAYSSMPDSGWAVRERLGSGVIDRHDRLELDGLGADAGAWRTCDDTGCSVDVVQDGAWTHYVLLAWAAPNTSSAIERWVRASFSA